jgi:hypothetical protein
MGVFLLCQLYINMGKERINTTGRVFLMEISNSCVAICKDS